MKFLTILACVLFTMPAFSITISKELSCQMEFGEHTTKYGDNLTRVNGINYIQEIQSLSHANYTCTGKVSFADHRPPTLVTELTLPSGASVKASSDSKNYQYVTETQAQVSCRCVLLNL